MRFLDAFLAKLFSVETLTWANDPEEVAAIENGDDEDEVQALYDRNKPLFWVCVVVAGVFLFEFIRVVVVVFG